MFIIYDAFKKAPTTSPMSPHMQRVLAKVVCSAPAAHREKEEQNVAAALVRILPAGKTRG